MNLSYCVDETRIIVFKYILYVSAVFSFHFKWMQIVLHLNSHF